MCWTGMVVEEEEEEVVVSEAEWRSSPRGKKNLKNFKMTNFFLYI